LPVVVRDLAISVGCYRKRGTNGVVAMRNRAFVAIGAGITRPSRPRSGDRALRAVHGVRVGVGRLTGQSHERGPGPARDDARDGVSSAWSRAFVPGPSPLENREIVGILAKYETT